MIIPRDSFVIGVLALIALCWFVIGFIAGGVVCDISAAS
jgi:hypothetical protein